MIFFQNIFGPEMGSALDAERPNASNVPISGTDESGPPDTTRITAIPYVGDATVSGSQTKPETTGIIYLKDWGVPFTWTLYD